MSLSYPQAKAALQAGDRIMVTNPDPMRPADTPCYLLVRAGVSITMATFRSLRPELTPVSDGLFPDATQTFVWGGAKPTNPEPAADERHPHQAEEQWLDDLEDDDAEP